MVYPDTDIPILKGDQVLVSGRFAADFGYNAIVGQTGTIITGPSNQVYKGHQRIFQDYGYWPVEIKASKGMTWWVLAGDIQLIYVDNQSSLSALNQEEDRELPMILVPEVVTK